MSVPVWKTYYKKTLTLSFYLKAEVKLSVQGGQSTICKYLNPLNMKTYYQMSIHERINLKGFMALLEQNQPQYRSPYPCLNRAFLWDYNSYSFLRIKL